MTVGSGPGAGCTGETPMLLAGPPGWTGETPGLLAGGDTGRMPVLLRLILQKIF